MESDAYTHLIAKAWKDPKFRDKLKTQPFATLSQLGIKVPSDKTVRIIEDDEKTFTIVIPSAPENADQLSEEELCKLAAGLQGEKVQELW